MLRRVGVGSFRLVVVPSSFRDGWDLADALPPGVAEADLERMLANADGHADHAGDPWLSPDLTLLGSGRRVAPPFPLELLGTFWSGWVARKRRVHRPPAIMSLYLSWPAQVRHWRTCAGRLPVPTGPNRQSSGVGSSARHRRASLPQWMLHSISFGRPRTEW